jgi:hypothetical protein
LGKKVHALLNGRACAKGNARRHGVQRLCDTARQICIGSRKPGPWCMERIRAERSSASVTLRRGLSSPALMSLTGYRYDESL